jgi:orotidine-5'-phosphate decarboxylase
MEAYADRLEAAVARVGSPCLVGLDPNPESMPEEFALARDSSAPRAARADAVGDFLCAVIDVARGKAAAVKPQSAFFELLGADGARVWERVVAAARAADLLVIGDVKRGDIDSTARAYAQAYLENEPRCDAITVNPYLGADAVQPFLDTCRRSAAGIYVLVRTSNKHSALFQDHGAPPLHEKVAACVDQWGAELVGTRGLSSVGAVVGATHPAELARLRRAMPRTPFLIPGYGAQGGSARDVAGGFLAGGRGALVNSSRAILYAYQQPAWSGLHWKDATAAALQAMRADLAAALR